MTAIYDQVNFWQPPLEKAMFGGTNQETSVTEGRASTCRLVITIEQTRPSTSLD